MRPYVMLLVVFSEIRQRKKIFVFHVTFWKFSGSVGRKKKFFHKKSFKVWYTTEPIIYSYILRKTRPETDFCRKVRETFLGRGFLTWVGRVTWNTNIFFPQPYNIMPWCHNHTRTQTDILHKWGLELLTRLSDRFSRSNCIIPGESNRLIK